MPVRANTGGTNDEIDSAELFKSFCSWLFDNINGEYKLVDIEGFVGKDSFNRSELIICGGSLFVNVIDFDIELIVEGRGWGIGNDWGVLLVDSSLAVLLEVFKADLRNFVTALNNKKGERMIIKKINKIDSCRKKLFYCL